MKDALSREEDLNGITIWAVYSNFEENDIERIEPLRVDQFCHMRQRYDAGAFNVNAINKASSHQISSGKNVK